MGPGPAEVASLKKTKKLQSCWAVELSLVPARVAVKSLT